MWQQYCRYNQALNLQTIVYGNKIKDRLEKSIKDSERLLQLQSNYYWVLKHLTIPHHKIATHGLNIFVSQSLFFKDGEASQVFLSKDLEDPTIKKISKQKLNNTFIQKVMADRRRRYKDYIRLKTGRKKVQQKKKLFFGQKEVKKQIKDAVLVRYIDGIQALLTENQFLLLLQKRKQDPIWKQILSIRNFINIPSTSNPLTSSTLTITSPTINQPPTSQHLPSTSTSNQYPTYLVTKLKPQKLKYPQLYKRSKILMKIYGEYINPGDDQYISHAQQLKFQRQLKNSDLKAYTQYLVYQIVSYVQYFYDEEIRSITIGIFYDQLGNAFINQVYRLETKPLVKFQWTNQLYRKIMDQQQTRILSSNKYHGQIKPQGNTKQISQAMHLAYQKMRDFFGLNAQDDDNQQQIANNNFFKKIHPNFDHNISDVLKDPHLTIADFKLKYLGYKKNKKPIIKQFTSPLIKTLHLTSPRLRRAQPHLYISPNKNNRTLSTFSNSDKVKKNRRFSLLKPLNYQQNGNGNGNYTERKMYETLAVRRDIEKDGNL